MLGSARDGSVLVRATQFVEFDAGEGVQRWEESRRPLADLGIAGLKVSRFEYRSAPQRIDVDPGLAERLILD